MSERSGILCLGAAPWVVNYNIALSTSDLESARRIARAVSTRGGQLPTLSIMFRHHY